jgi:hypothetical protein
MALQFARENPPRSGQLMSREVVAVVYRHVHDPSDTIRVHGFGNADIRLKWNERANTLTIEGLEEFTDVRMIAEANGDIRLTHKNGDSLWADIR